MTYSTRIHISPISQKEKRKILMKKSSSFTGHAGFEPRQGTEVPPDATPRIDSHGVEVAIIPPNRTKIQRFISDIYSELVADVDYQCLYAEALPVATTVHISLSTIRDRVEKQLYEDHFQLEDDLIALGTYWIHGPPAPNPLLPQYMAALKLLRRSTELMVARSCEIDDRDYYTGPDVEAAIKADSKLAQAANKAERSTASPSFARKIKKPQPSVSGPANGLKNIEAQIAKLTEQVMGMQTSSKGPSTVSSSSMRQDAMTADEIKRLEADLIRLSPDDIDYIIGTMLKDEPSVKIDEESYELDVGALPAGKQRALRRFVSRRLNVTDPAHEVHKLKQMLKQDELVKASEEMAERLLAASSTIPFAPPAALPAAVPAQPIISPEEEQRQRQREEEARRLWRLAHGEGDEDDMDLI
jgi:hypothetical protein